MQLNNHSGDLFMGIWSFTFCTWQREYCYSGWLISSTALIRYSCRSKLWSNLSTRLRSKYQLWKKRLSNLRKTVRSSFIDAFSSKTWTSKSKNLNQLIRLKKLRRKIRTMTSSLVTKTTSIWPQNLRVPLKSFLISLRNN